MPAELAEARRSRPAWVTYAGAVLAMVAFAANSIITRAALDADSIDPATYTAIRLTSGALVLATIVLITGRAAAARAARPVPWRSATFLFLYASAFSLAYLRIGAATGALILFGTVQTVMYATAIRRGERPGRSGWTGLALAFVGLVALVAPGVSAPDPWGAALMVVAGCAWAGYTLAGRAGGDPLVSSARNFVVSLPLALAFEVAFVVVRPGSVHVDGRGLGLALLSGAVASGLGYALWYSVLPSLTRVQSGIVQMAPPPIAATAGLLLLGEALTLRVGLSSVLILTGVAVGVLGARRPR